MNPNKQLPEEYEVDVVYPQFHAESGFCYDGSCPCKEDQQNIQNLGQAVQDGLVSTDDANRIYHGRTV